VSTGKIAVFRPATVAFTKNYVKKQQNNSKKNVSHKIHFERKKDIFTSHCIISYKFRVLEIFKNSIIEMSIYSVIMIAMISLSLTLERTSLYTCVTEHDSIYSIFIYLFAFTHLLLVQSPQDIETCPKNILHAS
jgi:hypothetical protein